MFVLIIGRRYGSPATASTPNGKKKLYKSVTLKEYETARDHGLPILAFVLRDIKADYDAYARHRIKGAKFSSVEDTQVLEFISAVASHSKNNLLVWFETADEIGTYLLAQLSGLLRKGVEDTKARRHKVPINPFKLFYFRIDRGGFRGELVDIERLSIDTSLKPNTLRKLEKLRAKNENPLSLENFPECELSDIEKIEARLNCRGQLRGGQEDDFLTEYLLTYHNRRSSGAIKSVDQYEFNFDTKAVVFDFDGTLSNEKDKGTVWERLWEAAGLSKAECSRYHNEFRQSLLTHQQWCDLTCRLFKERGLTRNRVAEVAREISLVPGLRTTIDDLKKRRVHTSILSGSVKEVIRLSLGDAYELFDDVRANEFEYDSAGVISVIHGTKYDFRTKPQFIREIIQQRRLNPLQVLFVGNSANDAWASRSGARTLCVNPIETDAGNFRNWTGCIRHMENLTSILPYTIGQTIE